MIVPVKIPSSTRMTELVGWLHLIYLGLLPSLATFGVLRTYGHPIPFLFFLGGVAAVGVYLAVTISYTRLPRSLGIALFTALDGPVLSYISLPQQAAPPFAFSIQGFLIDGVAIWLSIAVLALWSGMPTPEQRVASLVLAVVAVAVLGSAFWPYLRQYVGGNPASVRWLVIGILESFIAYHRLLKADEVVNDSNRSTIYIVALIMIWIFAMGAGTVLHELSHDS
ncbi:MAG: hypothetical protein KatS3mg057_0381 [Herpetosiphonaceae bacterium]|nr:MAG: hypothetical protein KatS3mg057_0381 [Herpetosiphonaceae bacterium]